LFKRNRLVAEGNQNCIRLFSLLDLGTNLHFFKDGIHIKSTDITTQLFTDLKVIAHIALATYLILDPFTKRRAKEFPEEVIKENTK
jgi:hypothetical protein